MVNFSLNEDLNAFKEIIRITKEKLSPIKDLDSLLDNILFETRHLSNSDAGSIYLTEGDTLKFSYVQNDSLYKNVINNKYLYSNHHLKIDDKSIAGYVALTGNTLVIDDAYTINKNLPYSFNQSFDKSANYRTKSILAVPLRTTNNKIIGVMEIINTLDSDNKMSTFKPEQIFITELFANEASTAIERVQMTRSMILRMIKMAELRDPKETGTHVNRVGSYCIEIYHKWASSMGISEKEIKNYKDNFRLASMLHDVGKIAISDSILKKPAKLTEEEFKIMQFHTVAGGDLFSNSSFDLDQLSRDVSLTHHEKWDGTGYPGRYSFNSSNILCVGKGFEKEEIPISGRIVALADVYDALISKRCYKDAWDEQKVLSHIEEQSGKHFDPHVVESFFSIYDVIQAIREKYSD
ncbi:MAG: hypothetical protein ACD_79C00352G0002 [uncultured bacterium]|nr:MAG: hypothetical protein ACD_79C00352G0002 [uncultured bacterium]